MKLLAVKLLVTTLIIILIGCTSPLVKAQVPVTVTSDIPGTINQLRIMEQWGQQYAQMTVEIEQLRQTYKAITGNGMFGVTAFNPSLVNYLPDEWKGIYNQVKNEDSSGIKGIATSIKKNENFKSTLNDGIQRYQDTLAMNKAMAMEAYDNTRKRLDNINTLMHKTNMTQNPKEAADLQNRIASENAIIQNEQTRINLMLKLQEIELKLAEEQKEREFKNKFYR